MSEQVEPAPDEGLDGGWHIAPDGPIQLGVDEVRALLIQQCTQRFGNHEWRLHLVPGSSTEVYCGNCPANLEDVWLGSTQLIQLIATDYTVSGESHTATSTVDIPVDVRIRESRAFHVQTMQAAVTMSVQIQPHEAALPSAQTGSTIEGELGAGAGWCAPSL